MPRKKFLGEKLRELRLERGFHNQGDLATAVGVSQNSISKWEAELSAPEPAKLDKLCKILKIQKSDLYAEMDPNEDLREVVREEVLMALEAHRLRKSGLPDDIADLLAQVASEEIWEAIRSFLKPLVHLHRRK